MGKKRVLILCTGNSCRSQMAEGFINHALGGTWQAESAGTQPSGHVHPMAVKVMAEIGIDISGAKSKSVDLFLGTPFDEVITVCDEAREICPVWPGQGHRSHIRFEDPAQATGSEAQRLAVFRRVRDEIHEQVVGFLA